MVVNVHSLRADQVLCSNLSPEQAIKIVQDFHVENGLIGVVETDVEFLRFDQSYMYKFDFDSFFGKQIWVVMVYFDLVDEEKGIFRKHYNLYVDDEKGEVVFYEFAGIIGGFVSGKFCESVISVVNSTRLRRLYPCYLKKSDYDDFENIDKLNVLDVLRMDFNYYYPQYYDEVVFE